VDRGTSRAPAKDDRNAWAEPGVEDLGGGLYRIPLPLPGDALTAVNVYAIAGEDGVDLIDAGMALAQARERLTEALGQLGYGPVRDSTHRRVNELLAQHETRLEQTFEIARGGPVSSFAVAAELPWTRRKRKLAELDPMNQLLAVGETAAHLEVLVVRGLLTRFTSSEGVDCYTLAQAAG
jgi:hypothetical protein